MGPEVDVVGTRTSKQEVEVHVHFFSIFVSLATEYSQSVASSCSRLKVCVCVFVNNHRASSTVVISKHIIKKRAVQNICRDTFISSCAHPTFQQNPAHEPAILVHNQHANNCP